MSDPPDADVAVRSANHEPVKMLTREQLLGVLLLADWELSRDGDYARDPYTGTTYRVVSDWEISRAVDLALKDALSTQITARAAQ